MSRLEAGVEAGGGIGPDAAPPSPTKEFVDEIRSSGLSFCGFGKEKQERVKDERNEERARSLFGVSALAIAKLHKDLHELEEEYRIKNFNSMQSTFS